MSERYAIVLGAAVWPGGEPSPTLRRRAARAAELWQVGAVTGIVASGGLGKQPPSEAEAIRALVTAQGVPGNAVILEGRSHSTLENIRNSIALLPEGADAVIVTDAWHLPRALLTAKRLGLSASGARTTLRGANPLRVAKAILREAAALIWYLLRPLG
jgi:uncharacterized SAM-binding protein YcdF (DUF218 family)